MKKKYLKENFEPIVLGSKNLTEVLSKLGMGKEGNSRTILRRYINIHNIDISHFESTKERYNRTLGKNLTEITISLDNILVANSTYNNTAHLKERLYKKGLKERKCELCGQGEEWNGNHMSLILDHINGISNDNRFENLRIVCPNCNAALPTHCRGANKVENFIRKQNIISENKKNELTEKNNKKALIKIESLVNKSIKARTVDRPSLNILLIDVEELGYSATGRKYGVSDNAIRKWIKFYTKFNK